MNLHETLTNGGSIAHGVPVGFRERPDHARQPTRSGTQNMARTRRHHSLLISIAVLGVLLLVPAGASAATCDWREMIDAAANKRQITTHTTACYEKALSELPGDVDGYAPEYRAALVAAMRRDASISTGRTGAGSRVLEGLPTSSPAVAASVRGPVTSLLEGLGPAHVDQVPLPVVALGSFASLLLLAGLGTSLVRMRARRLSR